MTTVLEPPAVTPGEGPQPPGKAAAADVDDERRRRQRRRRQLAWSVLPALAGLVAGSALVYTSWATERGIEAYEAGRADPEAYGTAVRWFDRAARLNVYEREVPPFDRGDALVGKGDLSGARTSFEEALGLAGDDRRCVVVVNLVLTIELQGDALTAVDELDARPMYAEAEAVIEANRDCLARTTPAGDGEGDRLARAAARLDDKSRVEQPDRRTQTRQDETTDADPVKPGDGDLDELERRLEDNAETRVEGRELDEGLDQGVPPHDGPSW